MAKGLGLERCAVRGHDVFECPAFRVDGSVSFGFRVQGHWFSEGLRGKQTHMKLPVDFDIFAFSSNR